MGLLSKLWVMVEQVNTVSASGSSSTVEMDITLELLERTVIGQCNNTITNERRKNVLLGVTGISPSQVVQCLKKRQHCYKNTIKRSLGKIVSKSINPVEALSRGFLILSRKTKCRGEGRAKIQVELQR